MIDGLYLMCNISGTILKTLYLAKSYNTVVPFSTEWK